MKALKWIGLGVGSFAALIGAIFAVWFMLTAGAAGAASEFLKLVSESKYEEAYQATTPQFRKDIKLDNFRAVITLERFETVSWTKREISSSGGATLAGTIKTRNGATVEVIVKLEKIDGAWKVYSVILQSKGAS